MVLWQPIIQKLMSQNAQATGVIQLNADALQVYSQYRSLTTEESIAAKDHRDDLDFTFAADDTNLSPDVHAAVDTEQTHLRNLQEVGKLRGERIDQDSRFSKLLYVTTEKKMPAFFKDM